MVRTPITRSFTFVLPQQGNPSVSLNWNMNLASTILGRKQFFLFTMAAAPKKNRKKIVIPCDINFMCIPSIFVLLRLFGCCFVGNGALATSVAIQLPVQLWKVCNLVVLLRNQSNTMTHLRILHWVQVIEIHYIPSFFFFLFLLLLLLFGIFLVYILLEKTFFSLKHTAYIVRTRGDGLIHPMQQ